MARKKIIAGNWKMNMTPSEAVKLVETLKPLVVNDEVDVVSAYRLSTSSLLLRQLKEQTSRLVLRTCTSRRKVLTQARLLRLCS